MSAAPFVPANPEFERGRVLRPVRTLTVCLAEVFAIDGDDRTPIATMLSTIIVRPRAPR